MTDFAAESGVPAGVDPDGVGRIIGQTGLRAEFLSRGRSNLTYRAWNDSGEWVVRRPPLGHVLEPAHDMAREFRILSALKDTPVPVPRTVAMCDDVSVLGAPFYVMEMVHGYVVGNDPPAGYADTADERRRMAYGVVDTLAAIHAVDWQAVGLEGFGRPEGYLERQVRRWGKQWEGNKNRELPRIDELQQRLSSALPPQSASTIVHGDYTLNNVMLASDDPGRVAAVLDWEMSTLGDPLADLGWVLSFGPGALPVRGDQAPFPPSDDLIERYGSVSGRSMDPTAFYVALARYKMAVIQEGIHARFLKGQTVGEGFANLGEGVGDLVERAHVALDGEG